MKATPSEDNHIRCSACGRSFEVALAVVTPPALAAAEAPRALEPAAAAAASSPPAAQAPAAKPKTIPPLGPEPAPASYGLMNNAAWTILLATVAYVGIRFFLTTRGDPSMCSDGVWRQAGSICGWIALGLSSMVELLLGGVLVALTGCATRLDRRASWLAWRSGSLDKPLSQPPGSSLPFLVPFCVSGGLMAILGLTYALGEDPGPDPLEGFGGAWNVTVGGGVLFLLGLACSEIRRFLWRMGELARKLVVRTRGGETSLGEAPKIHFHPTKSASAAYLLISTLFLMLAFGGWARFRLEPWFAVHQMADNPFEDAAFLQMFGLASGAFIAVVGGTYTLLRLSRLWSEMLYRWEWAAATVNGPRAVAFGQRSGRILNRSVWLISFVIAGATIVSIRAEGLVTSFTEFVTVYAALAGFSIFFLLWIGALKAGASRFVRATGVLAVPKRMNAEPGRHARRLAVALLLACTVLMLGMGAFLGFLLWVTAPDITSSAGLSESIGLYALLVSFSLLTYGLTLVPNFFWALLLRDFDRAAMYLESAGEAA